MFQSTSRKEKSRAFTLIELLIVMGIIGLLASIGLPALKGFGQGNASTAANRQLLDDLAEARLRAINSRSTVYLVFVSPTILAQNLSGLNVDERRQLTNAVNGQYTSYAMFTMRGLGDQPGRYTPRYLTDWRSLPEGMFIATNKYRVVDNLAWQSNYGTNNVDRPFAHVLIPFPTAQSKSMLLPYIAFDYKGQLLSRRNDNQIPYRIDDEVIPLSRGSVIYPLAADGGFQLAAAEVVETPRGNATNNFNRIRIDWVTGRARLEVPEL